MNVAVVKSLPYMHMVHYLQCANYNYSGEWVIGDCIAEFEFRLDPF